MFLYPSHLILECIVVTTEDVRPKDSPSTENKIVHIMLEVQSFITLMASEYECFYILLI